MMSCAVMPGISCSSTEPGLDIVGINGETTLKLDVKLSEPIFVYPAQPTEKQVYALSNLDQIFAVPVHTIYFFNARDQDKNLISDDVVAVIKDSLRKLLVFYYPYAGRLGLSEDSKLQIECGDQGAVFVEAVADCSIAELGRDDQQLYRPAPHDPFMEQLVYNPPTAAAADDSITILDVPLLYVQVTKFKCGGFVLGLNQSHCMLDGFGASEFLLAWGELARGSSALDISHLAPNLDRTLLNPRSPLRIEFPHLEFREINEVGACPDQRRGAVVVDHESSKSATICTSFTLSPQELDGVRRRILDEGLVIEATSFEILTALTWRARTQAADMHPEQVARLVFPINVRAKLDPPLPARFLGNGVFLGHATAAAAELMNTKTSSLSFIVKLVQDAKAQVTDSYIRSAIDYLEVHRGKPKSVALLYISSWTRIPLNVVDFGWGRPFCMAPCGLIHEDAIFTAFGNDMKSFKLFIGLPSLQAVETFHQCLHNTIFSS